MNNRISRRSLLAAAAAGAARPAQRPTNILLVTADDLGPLLSCYGEKLIRTPNLDRLASSGVRFQVAYVTQASCSPSRSSIFTGLYPHSTGQYGLTGAGFALHPHLHTATIPAVLKKAGYRTGIIGKLHVDPESTFPFDVNQKTFPTRRVREVASAAAAFLNQPARDPFFLMVNYSDPHAFRRENDRTAWYFPPQVEGLPEKPIQPGAATLFPWQQIDTPEQRERTANYYNAILRLDAGVGMLIEELEKAGRANDTLVIFCGDHGPPFARGKTTVYEHGLRVPFLVRWPGTSKPMVSSAMVSTVDIAPTIFDAAGVQSPVRMHGRSLRPVVGSARAPWREYLAGEFHFHGARPFYPRRAIRDGRYQLIHNLRAGKARPSTGIDGDTAYRVSREARYQGTPVRATFDTFADPPEFELYDLEQDPVEFENIAGREEAVLKRMQRAMREWRRETGDPFLDPSFVEKIARERA